MRTNTRKCFKCHKEIDISSDTRFIKRDGKYYHGDCFVRWQTSSKKRGAALSKEQCEEEIKLYQSQNRINIQQQVAEEELIKFLSEKYEIPFFPSYFYIKIKSVYNGEYKGLHTKVPPEHLLEMWQTKFDYLNRLNAKKEEPLEGINRIYYDLAILLSRYQKFLEWKERSKLELESIEKQRQEQKLSVDYSALNNSRSHVLSSYSKKDSKMDFDEILDEI